MRDGYLETFDLFRPYPVQIPNGVDLIPDIFTANGQDVEPTFIYRGDGATTSLWTPHHGYGETLAIAGSGDAVVPNSLSPFLGGSDVSCKYAGTANAKYHLASGTSFADITTEDIALRAVFRTSSDVTSGQYIVSKYGGSNGYAIYVISGAVKFIIRNGANYRILSISVSPDTWYDCIGLADMSDASGMHFYSQGVLGASGNPTAVGSLTVSTSFAIGVRSDAVFGFSGYLAYASLHKKANWLDTAEFAALAHESHVRATGFYPLIANGTKLPISAEVRSTSTVVYKYESDGTPHIMKVGPNWLPCDQNSDGVKTYRPDSQETNHIQHSSALNTAPWAVGGTATVTENSTDLLDPMGLNGSSKVVVNDGANNVAQSVAGLTNDAKQATGIWIYRSSTSGVLYIENPAGSADGQWEVDLSALPDRWVRLKRSSSYITVNNEFAADGTGNAGIKLYAKSGGPLTFYVYNSQQEENGGYEVTADIGPTAGGSETRNASVLTHKGDDGNLGGVGSEKQGAIEMVIVAPANPPAASIRLLALSDGGSANDRINLSIHTSGSVAAYTNATGGTPIDTIGPNICDGKQHTVRLVWSESVIELFVDEVLADTDSITAADVPDDLDQIDVGMFYNDTQQYNHGIESIKIWRRPVRR